MKEFPRYWKYQILRRPFWIWKMAEISSESHFFFWYIANMIPGGPLNKMVPLMEDHGVGVGGARGPPLAHGLMGYVACQSLLGLLSWCHVMYSSLCDLIWSVTLQLKSVGARSFSELHRIELMRGNQNIIHSNWRHALLVLNRQQHSRLGGNSLMYTKFLKR